LGGRGKESPMKHRVRGASRGGGGQHRWRGPAGGASTGGGVTGEEGPGGEGPGGEGSGGGEVDGCIMHQVHTSVIEENN
jgi:hypothetical protein